MKVNKNLGKYILIIWVILVSALVVVSADRIDNHEQRLMLLTELNDLQIQLSEKQNEIMTYQGEVILAHTHNESK